MTQIRLAACAISILLSTMAGVAHAQPIQIHNCPGPSAPPDARDEHKRLFEYAVLAGLVYRDQHQARLDLHACCPAGIAPQGSSPTVSFQPVPRHIIHEAASAISEQEPAPQIEFYVDVQTGEESVTCTRSQTFTERLALAFRYVRRNDRLRLFIKFAILGVTTLTGREELRVLELRRDGPTSQNDGGTVLGIQGTDFTSLSQWNTSIRNLIADSCPFDFAVEVAKRFFGPESVQEFGASRHSIVGHSLGGAVAQHVAQHADLQAVIERFPEGATFNAYSFNSIGVAYAAPDVAHQDRISSVRIAGELLEQLERVQIYN